MPILDSGKRREFKSGAVRDIDVEKGRCDLMPLNVIAKLVNDDTLLYIYKYQETGSVENLYTAIELFIKFRLYISIPEAMLQVSKHYAEGAKKYAERNWEKGLPISSFIDSAVRHFLKYIGNYTDEPHDRAFLWNLLGAIWTHNAHPEVRQEPLKQNKNAKT